MTVRDLYKKKQPVFSLEVFPPKKEGGDNVGVLHGTLARIANLAPDFISVTCGVSGKSETVEIADYIQKRHEILSLAHLTCAAMTRADIEAALVAMRKCGVRNVLALRGDIPRGTPPFEAPDYRYAEDLIRDLRGRESGLCIGAACYPEGHIACGDLEIDIARLRRKEEAGADFLITQLFFENGVFYRFLERAGAAGVTLPISAGIMPIISLAQIQRMIFMCGASLPSKIIKILHKYENNAEDLRKAGIEYTAAQAEELAVHGADGIHVYTMNRPEIAEACASVLGRA